MIYTLILKSHSKAHKQGSYKSLLSFFFTKCLKTQLFKWYLELSVKITWLTGKIRRIIINDHFQWFVVDNSEKFEMVKMGRTTKDDKG